MTGNAHILPDSRLKDKNFGVIIAQNIGLDGKIYTQEMIPIYCANCGKEGGHCTKEQITFMFYLCNKCFEKHGSIAGTYAVSDEEFCRNVVNEMIDKFGRPLTDREIFEKKEKGELGKALELLEKESPYPVFNEGT